jgi:dTDP-4-amino-4,6-dideoxygalactose transaminase
MGMIKLPKRAIHKFESNYAEIFETGNLAEGKWNKELASFFVNYTGARHAMPFNSNGSGLLTILMLLKKHRKYKNVFIQSNTMYGVKTIAVTSGLNFLEPVPCSLPSLMPSAQQVRKYIEGLHNPSETIFLITHIGGIVNPDIEEIAAICKSQNVALVEDCAHSLGSTLNGKHTGLFGIAGVYSLYSTKAVAAGEGGISVTNDIELGYLIDKFQIYDRFDQKEEIGVNFRVSELQALLSLSVCECSEEIIENKTAIADRYIIACEKQGIRYVDPYSNGQRGNHYKFSIIAENNAAEEFKLITNRTSPVYDYTLGEDPFLIHSKHICLPIWFELDESTISKTIEQIGMIHF